MWRRIGLWWFLGCLVKKKVIPSVLCRRQSCDNQGCLSWALEKGPRHQYLQSLTNSPGSLSEVFLQYLLSIHSLPQCYSILRLLAFKHLHVCLISDGVKAITCSHGPSTIHSLHQALWHSLLCAASIKSPPRSRLRSDYSVKTVLADCTHDRHG